MRTPYLKPNRVLRALINGQKLRNAQTGSAYKLNDQLMVLVRLRGSSDWIEAEVLPLKSMRPCGDFDSMDEVRNYLLSGGFITSDGTDVVSFDRVQMQVCALSFPGKWVPCCWKQMSKCGHDRWRKHDYDNENKNNQKSHDGDIGTIRHKED